MEAMRGMQAGGVYARAEAFPERTVWIEPSGTEVSAEDLLSTMNQVADGLHQRGLVAGDGVAVVLTNRREFVEAYGAAIQSGLCFVAVNWHLTAAEISYLLQ